MTTELKVAETPAEVAKAMTDFAQFMNAPKRTSCTLENLFKNIPSISYVRNEGDTESDFAHHGLLGSELI